LRERHLDYSAAHIQHIQKALTYMSLHLHHVVSDITGVTGMRIIRAIIAGERAPEVLARPHSSCRHMPPMQCKRASIRLTLQPDFLPNDW
jgi:hypothetical protein